MRGQYMLDSFKFSGLPGYNKYQPVALMGRSSSRDRKEKRSRKERYPRDEDRDVTLKTSSPNRSRPQHRSSKSRDKKDNRDYRPYEGRPKNKRDRSTGRSRSKQARKHSRQRSRSHEKRKDISEEDEMRLKQKRLAMVRLLGINDAELVNSNTSDNRTNAKSEQSKLENKEPKKKSRWEKSGAGNSTVASQQIASTKESIKEEPSKPLQQHSDLKNLSLDMYCPSDQKDLPKISDSVDIEDQQVQDKYNSCHTEDDTFDAYMRQIQGDAVQQKHLTKPGRQTSITYEDIVTVSAAKPVARQRNPKQVHVNDQKFKQEFMKAFQKVNANDVIMEEEETAVQKADQTQVLQGVDGQDSEDNSRLGDQGDEGDFFDKQKKMAERKQFHQIDHSQIKYQEVKFNLYRESDEVKNMTKEEVDTYRREAGDIKVRGKNIANPVDNWYLCGLSDKMLEIIEQREYKRPFPIQAQSFPLMMSGRDVIGIAQTGSGKTLAYLIPVIKHIESQRKVEEGEGPIALIMTPTRQLTRQVHEEFKKFCKPMGIRCLSVYGGLGMQTQLSDLKKGAQIIICTPGRMIDVLTLNNGKITNLRRVTMIVMDEADRMFDLGFQPQIAKVLNNVRPARQTVMFSATFPKNVEILAKRILKKPVEIVVGSRGQACSNIDQIIEVRQQTTKFWRLLQILGHWNNKGSILIFMDKKSQVDFLFKELIAYGYYSLPLHSGMDATDRQSTIYDFKKGVRTIMIATSICSRGLDIKNIVLVINFKCPNHLQDYIHRIGRTGRAGNKGTAITFITPEQQQYSLDMLKALQMADITPSEELKSMGQTYLTKVKKGEVRKRKNQNLLGIGYKFNEQEQDNDQFGKDIVKKQLKAEGLGAFDDSDDEDIERQKKREEDKRGRSDKQKAAEAIKDPQLKQKLLIQTAKALNEAMKDGTPMTTEKILKLAVEKMKEEVTKHVVIKTNEDAQAHVLKLVDEIQKTNPNGPTFSYDFEINDYPPNARSKATNNRFLSQIRELTSCTVSVRGQYFQAGKKVPLNFRKLYLHIRGQNKLYVSGAFKEIKRMLQEQSMQNYQGQLAIKYGMG